MTNYYMFFIAATNSGFDKGVDAAAGGIEGFHSGWIPEEPTDV